jgi:virginiamycin B lyase
MSSCHRPQGVGLALLVCTTLVCAACGSGGNEPPESAASASSGAGQVELPDSIALEDVAGTTEIPARPNADWVALADDSAWVANVGKGLGRYNLGSGTFVGSTPIGNEVCTAMETGYDSVWVANCLTSHIYRVDSATGRVLAKIKLPFRGPVEEGSLAAGGGGVFAISAERSKIASIDPATDQVSDQFVAPRGAGAVRFGFGSLWVTSPIEGTISRMDPRSGEVLSTITADPGIYFLATGAGGVWVMNNFTGVVLHIDPVSNEIAETITVSASPINGGDIAVGGGSVWARVSDVLVSRIDPVMNRVVERYGSAKGSGSVAADDDAVWISAHDVFVVWRVPIS